MARQRDKAFILHLCVRGGHANAPFRAPDTTGTGTGAGDESSTSHGASNGYFPVQPVWGSRIRSSRSERHDEKTREELSLCAVRVIFLRICYMRVVATLGVVSAPCA